MDSGRVKDMQPLVECASRRAGSDAEEEDYE